jgi:hypothetical protein
LNCQRAFSAAYASFTPASPRKEIQPFKRLLANTWVKKASSSGTDADAPGWLQA